MNRKPLDRHPCNGREALRPWKSNHLYIDDTGQVLCGRCMGVESTYTPWAWSDLGPMDPDRGVRTAGFEVVWRCDTDRYAHRA